MFERILKFSIHQRLAGAVSHARSRGVRGLQLSTPAHRCCSRHHQRPGTGQYKGTWLFSLGDRTTHHLPDRNRHGRSSETPTNPLAVPVWDPVKRHTKIRILYNCGRADDLEVAERLRRLARSILRRCSPEDIVSENPQWQLLNVWPYGDSYVLEQLWNRLGMAEVIGEVLDRHKVGFAVERAQRPTVHRASGGSRRTGEGMPRKSSWGSR
jgi:hypothetical protein